MYSETLRLLGNTFTISSESMFIYASQGTLKQMLYAGIEWVNDLSLKEFLSYASIQDRKDFLTCYVVDNLGNLNGRLPYPVEGVAIEIDFLTKRIYFQFYMQG